MVAWQHQNLTSLCNMGKKENDRSKSTLKGKLNTCCEPLSHQHQRQSGLTKHQNKRTRKQTQPLEATTMPTHPDVHTQTNQICHVTRTSLQQLLLAATAASHDHRVWCAGLRPSLYSSKPHTPFRVPCHHRCGDRATPTTSTNLR